MSRRTKLSVVAGAVLTSIGAAAFALLGDDDHANPPAGQSDVFSVDVESGEVRNRTETKASEYLLSLSPDGRLVAFFEDDSGRSTLNVMDVGGENRRQLTLAAPAGRALGERGQAPAWSPDGKTIAFDRSRDCHEVGCYVWEVLVVDVDGGAVRRLVDEARAPTWSPDGTLVAFEGGVGEDGVGATVDVIRPDGSGRRRISLGRSPLWSPRGNLIAYHEPSGFGVVRPDGSGARRLFVGSAHAWSPDGSRLAFTIGGVLKDPELLWTSVDGRQANRITRLRGTDRDASWAPDGKRLAWSHDDEVSAVHGVPTGYLYVGRTDGSPPRRLVSELYRDLRDVTWSRDGAQVLYTARVRARVVAGSIDIHSVAVEGEQEAVLKTPMQDSLPSPSPDGRRLAFYADEETGSYLYVTDADGGARRRLAEGTDTEVIAPAPPAWSPDGSTVAFVRDFGCADRLCTTWEIWLVGVDGGGLRRLVTGGREPHWSPDGDRITYTGVDGYVHVISASGTARRRLAPGFRPQWSPRGDRIAYLRGSVFPALWMVRPDGTDARRLKADFEPNRYVWSPDGRRLAFEQLGPRPHDDIYVVDVDERRPRPLLTRRGDDRSPVFSPDGNRLAWVNGRFIYVARANGTGTRRLTQRPHGIGDPLRWSTNGRIYFTVWPRRSR